MFVISLAAQQPLLSYSKKMEKVLNLDGSVHIWLYYPECHPIRRRSCQISADTDSCGGDNVTVKKLTWTKASSAERCVSGETWTSSSNSSRQINVSDYGGGSGRVLR